VATGHTVSSYHSPLAAAKVNSRSGPASRRSPYSGYTIASCISTTAPRPDTSQVHDDRSPWSSSTRFFFSIVQA
jgi:hypothetical protein